MPPDDKAPKADAETVKESGTIRMNASASGRESAAAAGLDAGTARGGTSAAAGFTALAENAKREKVDELLRECELLNESQEHTLVALLQRMEKLDVTVANVKETVDDLWADEAAEKIRGSAVSKGALKELLQQVVESGLLKTLLGALVGGPKV